MGNRNFITKHTVRRISGLLLILLCLVVFCACEEVSFPGTETEADTAEEKKTALYTLIRGDAASEEEVRAAVYLRNTVRELLGVELNIETDWVKRGERVEDHRYPHEILFGTTNRPESTDAKAALCEGTREMIDYTVTDKNGNYVIAASKGEAQAAADAFLALIREDTGLLFREPETTDVSRKHVFPLEDILICGTSLSEYRAVLYPADAPKGAVTDIRELADELFSACGVLLPVQKDDAEPEEGPVIRIGAGKDASVLAAGGLSYALVPSEDGLFLDGCDIYSAGCAVDLLRETLTEAESVGGVFLLNEPQRVLDERKDTIIRSAWTIAAPDMKTEAQFAELADCGFNQVILARPQDEDMLYRVCKWMTKYGLRALWSDGGISSPRGWKPNLTGVSLPYADAAVTWGHMLCDEPNAADFANLADAYDRYTAALPGKTGYINLYPKYASAEQLGTASYEAYAAQFLDTVKPAFASADVYPLNRNGIMRSYFGDIDSFTSACRSRGIPFGIYIQSVSFHESKRTPTEEELRWQAWCALAFGAEDIEYFTYRTPDLSGEQYLDALIGRDNEKTDGWYGAQRVNAELEAMGEAFLSYKSLGAYTVNAENVPYMQFENQYRTFDAVSKVTVSDDRPVLIGAFAAKDGGGGRAFVCVNGEDPGRNAAPMTVSVRLTKAETAVLRQSGKPTALKTDADGTISFTLAPGEGVLVTLP